MYKMICCDVDGTLLNDDKKIPLRNIEYIKKAIKDRGTIFSIVSGRMPSGVYRFYDEMGIEGPFSCYNGCLVCNDKRQIIEEYRMDKHIVSLILDSLEELNIEGVLFDNDTWYIEKENSYAFNRRFKHYNSYPKICSFRKANIEFNTNKILAVSPDPEKLKQLENRIKEKGINESEATFYRSETFFEVMPYGINKGVSLDLLAKYYNIGLDEILAIGDDYNDFEMLQKAGCGVAMANSVPEAFDFADVTVCSNNDGGVAEAIDRFIL